MAGMNEKPYQAPEPNGPTPSHQPLVPTKKFPSLAFLLSFVIPGAGLMYLGKWKWGLLNLGVVFLIGVVAALVLSDEAFESYARYVGYGCAGGSAGLAQVLATQMNAKSNPPAG